jgi:hypothetical protein
LTARDWWNLVPDQTIFATGVGSERTLNAAMRHARGAWAIAYLASQTGVFVNLDRITTRTARATFVNPATGEKKDAGSHATGNLNGRPSPDSPKQLFTTPDHWEDAVLLLEGLP